MSRSAALLLVVSALACLLFALSGSTPAWADGFNAAVNYPLNTGAGPRALAVADLNGDSIADLTTANEDGNSLSTLLGGAGGGFGSATQYTAGQSPFGVVVGNFTGQGHQDVAIINQNDCTTQQGSVEVFTNDGHGVLTQAGLTPVPNNFCLHAIVAGDFLGNGQLELAVLGNGTNAIYFFQVSNTGALSVWGSPVPTGLTAGTPAPTGLVAGDFNGDGKADLAVAGYNTDSVSVLLNSTVTTPAFTSAAGSPYSTGAGSQPVAVAVGDFNGDGKPDIASANYGGNSASLLLNSGSGTFPASPPNFPTGATNPLGIAVGDFNRDGSRDVATANQGSNNVSVLLGNGAGAFAAPGIYPAGTTPQAVATGDFNGDGYSDLAVANRGSSNVSVLLAIPRQQSAAPPVQFFEDVPPSSLFFAATAVVAFKGWMVGYACGGPLEPCVAPYNRPYFRPFRDITRGQAAKPLALQAGYTDRPALPRFSDVSTSSPFYTQIEQLASRDVLHGDTDGTFHPNNSLTRSILARAVAHEAGYADKPTTPKFSDVPATLSFYTPIEQLASRNIMPGYSDGAWRPFANMSRGQFANVLSKLETVSAKVPQIESSGSATTVRASKNGTVVLPGVKIHCPPAAAGSTSKAGCRVNVNAQVTLIHNHLRITVGQVAAKKRATGIRHLTIGRSSYTIRAGATKPVSFRLTRKALAYLDNHRASVSRRQLRALRASVSVLVRSQFDRAVSFSRQVKITR